MGHGTRPLAFPRSWSVIEAYDGFTDMEEVVMEKISVWVQILDLPPLFRKEPVIRSMAKKIGQVESVMLNPRWGNGRIIRVRVRLDIKDPLLRVLSITKAKKKVYYPILYEKMPVFCYVCGF